MLRDELSRLPHQLAVSMGASMEYKYVDVSKSTQSFFERRLNEFSSTLPTDNAERAQQIMQLVEKRLVRHIPSCLVELVELCIRNWH